MGLITLFGTIHVSHGTILANFYLHIVLLAKSFQFQQNKHIQINP